MSEWLPLVVSSVLTILGWCVAFFWTARQVNIAHVKNRELQTAMLRQSKKDSLANAFIHIYIDLAQTIGDLRHYLFLAQINMDLEARWVNKVRFGWREQLELINTSYSELGRHFDHLLVWLDVHGEHIPNAAGISSIIAKYETHFTARSREKDNAWLVFQSAVARLRIQNEADPTLYSERVAEVAKWLAEILADLKAEAKTVEKHLLSPDSIVI